MRSSVFISTRMFFLIAAFLTVNRPNANPVAPMPITSVFFIDSLHWIVEFNVRELGFYDKIPDQTDTITLGCASETASKIPMQECVMPVKINPDSGTGTVTSNHFPGLRLKPGWRVFIGVKNDEYPSAGPELPESLKPNSTLTLHVYQSTCSEYIGPEQYYTYPCTRREYELADWPPCTSGNGRIAGVLTDKHNIPLTSFYVACFSDIKKSPVQATQTASNGSFQLSGLDLCPSYILKFVKENFMTDYTVGPLLEDYPQILDLSIRIQYPPVNVTHEQKTVTKEGVSAVRLLPSSGSRGNPVVLAVSDPSLTGKGSCDIYALNGGLIRSMAFTCRGAGTYSIDWEGTDSDGQPVPAATYLCRIKIGQEYVCRSFITR